MESIYCRTTPKSGILWVKKWDFNMSSTLERARNIGMAGLFTVLSLGIAANGNKAYSKVPLNADIELVTDDPGEKDAPSDDKPVPGKDLRNERYDVSRFASAGLSKKGVVILYCGTDRATFDEIRQGATEARSKGANVIGVIWGQTDPEVADGKDFFAIYAGGQTVRKPDTNTTNIRATVKENCQWASETFGEYMTNESAPSKTSQEVAGITSP